MDARNLIRPLVAGDLVKGSCILAAQERGDGVQLRILECMAIKPIDEGTYRWNDLPAGSKKYPEARATFTFRDRHTLNHTTLELKASTPLLLTRVAA